MAANDLPNANTDMDLDELLEGGVEEVSNAKVSSASLRIEPCLQATSHAVIKAKMGKLTAEQKTDIDALVLEFHDIFALTESELTQTNLVMHGIETIDERPISTRVRQIPYALREKFAAMLKDFLARGLISPSTSPYASPVVLVAKKEKDSIRMCVD
ncbi:hypothetical protein AAVH_39101 [Aphelenchoides avenae]|nr:hypothetical protein AAVH_39101 [Aphelenchus avenae]